MKDFKVGYTQGVYDMFHVGHLNLINRAKERCDYLIVGVNSDQLVETYKHRAPVICQEERRIIVANLKAVDMSTIVTTLNKAELWKEFHFDAVFIGDDWKGTSRWLQTERALAEYGVPVVYLPYTNGVSSTVLRPENDNKVEER